MKEKSDGKIMTYEVNKEGPEVCPYVLEQHEHI